MRLEVGGGVRSSSGSSCCGRRLRSRSRSCSGSSRSAAQSFQLRDALMHLFERVPMRHLGCGQAALKRLDVGLTCSHSDGARGHL